MRDKRRPGGKLLRIGGMLLALVFLTACGREESETGKDTVVNKAPQEDTAGQETGSGKTPQEGTMDQGEALPGLKENRSLYEKNTLSVKQEDGFWKIANGEFCLDYDIQGGSYAFRTGKEGAETILDAISARAVLKDGTEVTTGLLMRDPLEGIQVSEIEDGFGTGIKVEIQNHGDAQQGLPDLLQRFYVYENLPYFLSEAVAVGEQELSTNYIAPIFAGKGDYKSSILASFGEEDRFLFVPFDNDAYVRYESKPIIAASDSYEVTAVFDNESRRGIVAGSVTHDTWKTGIKVRQGGMNVVVEFSVYGGVTSPQTRDTLPHGYVSGREVTSPRVFVGCFEDYRDGLEAYGTANGIIAPPLEWDHGVPMGWNSWSAVADKVNYEIYTDASDFVKEYLQDNSFSEDGVVYINFDSFWDNLSEKELKDAAQYVRDNGQIPGIYMTPFAYWNTAPSGAVPGTNNRYGWLDVVLKDEEGVILPPVDGALSVDPTHPGILMNLEYQLNRFREWGFSYVKMDFMSHGAREGHFYEEGITTGIQAYNYGLQKIHEVLKEELEKQEFFISFSIAPIFPGQYAHGRRISCDVFGTIDSTEYQLNSLTYGWWLNGTVYPFCDPDHIVLYNSFNHRQEILFNEGLSRYISAAITGTVMIDSDDLRMRKARERVVEILTNEEINAVAKKGEAFRPVEGDTGDRACDTFVRYEEEEEALYLAVFNFSASETKTMVLDLERIGLDASLSYEMYDLWSGETAEVSDGYEIYLEEAQPKLLRLRARE